MKRQFSEMLTEMIEGILVPQVENQSLVVTSVDVDLPIEVGLRDSNGGWQFLADLPDWRWQTGWEPERGRLKVTWEAAGGQP